MGGVRGRRRCARGQRGVLAVTGCRGGPGGRQRRRGARARRGRPVRRAVGGPDCRGAARIRCRSSGSTQDAVLAVNADEVWLPAAPVSDGRHGSWPGPRSRGTARRWVAVGPVTSGDVASAPVLASDGAVWQATPQGLARIEGDDSAVVDEDIGASARTRLRRGWGLVLAVLTGMSCQSSRRLAHLDRATPGKHGVVRGNAVGGRPRDCLDVPTGIPRRGLSRLLSWDGEWSDGRRP